MFEGLKHIGGFGSVLKQAQEMGVKLQGLKDGLRNRRAQGSAGAGMVTVEVNGLCEVLSCRIDPSLIQSDDREMLEDLIVAAVNQAFAKARELHAEAVKSITGNIPGLGDLLGKIDG